MPTKEIKELRQAGKIDEAFAMAKKELEEMMKPSEPILIGNNVDGFVTVDNSTELIWAKRNMGWCFYAYLKANCMASNYSTFMDKLNQLAGLKLPEDEKMLFDHVSWLIGKMVFALLKAGQTGPNKFILLYKSSVRFPFTKPSEGYSFLYKAFHKAFKDTNKFIPFADKWDFKNFRDEDYQKGKMPDGKELMSIAEQAYINYARHLLPIQTTLAGKIFNKERALAFIPKLDFIIDKYPKFQYPAYFKAKLLLALGDEENMLSGLLPFAKKKRNFFWAWEILSEAFKTDETKVLACYCKALTCLSPEEMLVGIRQKMASLLIKKQFYNEARTEIAILLKTRNSHEFKIPEEVKNWEKQEWYKSATPKKSNIDFYSKYTEIADDLLFSDKPEESIIVEFVNSDKKILNFITSDNKVGSIKYNRFNMQVNIGETLKIRFQNQTREGYCQASTLRKCDDVLVKEQFIKNFEGPIKIFKDNPFGFIEENYVPPAIVTKNKLTDGKAIKGKAIKSFNPEKKLWGWKVYELEVIG